MKLVKMGILFSTIELLYREGFFCGYNRAKLWANDIKIDQASEESFVNLKMSEVGTTISPLYEEVAYREGYRQGYMIARMSNRDENTIMLSTKYFKESFSKELQERLVLIMVGDEKLQEHDVLFEVDRSIGKYGLMKSETRRKNG